MDDSETIRKVQRGDINAFEHIVYTYQSIAIKIASIITGDPSCAEDVVQNTFIKVYKNLHHFDTNKQFFPWFYKILIHESINYYHKHKKYIAHDMSNLTTSRDEYAHLITRIDLFNSIRKLPLEQRLALVYKYYLGLSEQEIADVLKCPVNTVKSRLFYARKKLNT